jgi:hypothetical protein
MPSPAFDKPNPLPMFELPQPAPGAFFDRVDSLGRKEIALDRRRLLAHVLHPMKPIIFGKPSPDLASRAGLKDMIIKLNHKAHGT